MKRFLFFQVCTCFYVHSLFSQDTFSIVAVDPETGEVGSAGASCVDMINFPGYPTDFLGELFPGKGAINTQASYNATNQDNAADRMNAGYTPQEIIDWLKANDVSNSPQTRQYGIAAIVNGFPQAAAHTGSNCIDYKNHITGPAYSIQGNILLGQKVLDSMEARFNREKGDLACKLMAALQGANMVGADTRCASNGTSSLFAFVKVAQSSDSPGSPSFLLSVKTRDNAGIEPVDSLQKLFDEVHSCSPVITGVKDFGSRNRISISPNPASGALKIRVSGDTELTEVVVRDLLGQKVYEDVIKGEIDIDVSGWEKGLYFVEHTDGTTATTEKVVIR